MSGEERTQRLRDDRSPEGKRNGETSVESRDHRAAHAAGRHEHLIKTLAHDLQSPLAVAKGHLEAARRGEAAEDLAKARRALDRMETILEEGLALAEQEVVAPEPEAVDFATTVRRAWSVIETGEASLDIEIPPATTVQADESQLGQLLENLLRNAVEHGEPTTTSDTERDRPESSGAGMSRQPTAVSVRVGTVADSSGFYVADDGAGIAAEQQEAVFEAGFTTATDGTGFGLAIVREIATAHDWSIELTDSATGGARFELTGVEMSGG